MELTKSRASFRMRPRLCSFSNASLEWNMVIRSMSYRRSSSWASAITCEGEVRVGVFTRISAS